MLEPCKVLCDVGCDHGYTCICSVTEGKAERALACDIARGPLSRAEDNIREAGLSDQITTCLSNGLTDVNEPFDALCISGMGGLLIREILEKGAVKLLPVRQMLLSPHSESDSLRSYIEEETGFYIRKETVLKDAGKFYVIMDLRRKEENAGQKKMTRAGILFGEPERETDLSAYYEMLSDMKEKLTEALSKAAKGTSENAGKRYRELREKVSELENIIKGNN